MNDIIDRTDLAKALSDVSRNAGKVTFKITYTSTDGNLAIDKAFQKFCGTYTNNEYLAGIAFLLQTWEHYKDVKALEAYIQDLAKRIQVLESDDSEKESEVKKTF